MNAKVIVAAKLLIRPTRMTDQFWGVVLPLRDRLVSALREFRTLAALRDAPLPKLISGELWVKGAERFVTQSLYATQKKENKAWALITSILMKKFGTS